MREPSARGRSDLRGVLIVIAVIVLTMIVGFLVKKDKDIFIVGYIVAIAYVMRRPAAPQSTMVRDRVEAPCCLSQRPEEGVVPRPDCGAALPALAAEIWSCPSVWVLPPAAAPHHPTNLARSPALAVAALILTLLETIVYQVCIQERLSWFIGTPAAIFVAIVLAGFAHAVGTPGSFHVVLTDSAGVALDFIVFGIIWARTHNLALTWLTHYAADIVGIIALAMIF